MKRFLHVSVCLLICNVIMAGNIGKQEAKRRAAAFMGKEMPMTLVAVDKDNQPSYYVFNAQRKSGGFVIVSGEESDGDEIIGYSETGGFDPQDMPPALQYMLECYSEQVAMIRSGAADRYRTQTIHTEVAPLLTTMWDQNAPYNLYNPINPVTSSRFTFAGCMATAMAQIVKYWSSPVPVQAIPSYTYYLSSNGNGYSTSPTSGYTALTVEGLPSTTFDFGCMEDVYYSSTADESINEVARLIAYCGRATEMRYTTYAGGAPMNASLFSRYFGYNPNANEVLRSDYTAAEWDEMVYQELQSHRPVIYSGRSVSSAGQSGHAFVCDGYRDGLFHINWGWNGKYNGYFKLSECNPYGTGSGGSQSKDGYSVSQSMLIGVQPSATSPFENRVRMLTTSLSSSSTTVTRTSTTKNFAIPLTFSVFSAATETCTFDYGIGIYSGDNLVNATVVAPNIELGPNYGNKDASYTMNWGRNFTNGTYILRNLSRLSGSGESGWIANKNSDVYYLVLTIDGNTMTISEPGNTLSIGSVDMEGVRKEGKIITLKSMLTNNGLSNTNVLYLFVDGILVSGAGANVDPGASDEVLLHFVAPSAGTHQLAIYKEISSSRLPVGDALWTGSIDIEEGFDPNVSVSHCTIWNMNTTDRTITGTDFSINVNVINNDTQPFQDEITFRLYKLYDTENGVGTLFNEKVVPCTISAGASKMVQASFDDLPVGDKYWINVYYSKPSDNSLVRIFKTGSYMILGENTAIYNVYSDTAERYSPCYNLSGQRVEKPVKGIYIKGGKKMVVK